MATPWSQISDNDDGELYVKAVCVCGADGEYYLLSAIHPMPVNAKSWS